MPCSDIVMQSFKCERLSISTNWRSPPNFLGNRKWYYWGFDEGCKSQARLFEVGFPLDEERPAPNLFRDGCLFLPLSFLLSLSFPPFSPFPTLLFSQQNTQFSTCRFPMPLKIIIRGSSTQPLAPISEIISKTHPNILHTPKWTRVVLAQRNCEKAHDRHCLCAPGSQETLSTFPLFRYLHQVRPYILKFPGAQICICTEFNLGYPTVMKDFLPMDVT